MNFKNIIIINLILILFIGCSSSNNSNFSCKTDFDCNLNLKSSCPEISCSQNNQCIKDYSVKCVCSQNICQKNIDLPENKLKNKEELRNKVELYFNKSENDDLLRIGQMTKYSSMFIYLNNITNEKTMIVINNYTGEILKNFSIIRQMK